MINFAEIHPSYRISDEVWQRISWAIPPEPPKPKGGRPRMDNRKALDAMFYVLRTGCQWKALPRSLGASSIVHDRYQEWADQGVFEQMWELGLEVCSKSWNWLGLDVDRWSDGQSTVKRRGNVSQSHERSLAPNGVF